MLNLSFFQLIINDNLNDSDVIEIRDIIKPETSAGNASVYFERAAGVDKIIDLGGHGDLQIYYQIAKPGGKTFRDTDWYRKRVSWSQSNEVARELKEMKYVDVRIFDILSENEIPSVEFGKLSSYRTIQPPNKKLP